MTDKTWFSGSNIMPLDIGEINLKVPPYQRELNERHLQQIISNWQDELVNPLVVSVRTHNLIDGNHTRHALLRQGYTMAPGRFVDCATVEIEMEFFDKLNTSKRKLTPYERHTGYLAMQEPLAIRVEHWIKECTKETPHSRSPWAIMRNVVSRFSDQDLEALPLLFETNTDFQWKYITVGQISRTVHIYHTRPEAFRKVLKIYPKLNGVKSFLHFYNFHNPA